MKVKNIMFSGIMAAILAGPALAADPVVATVASTGYVDAKVRVNADAIADNTAAIAEKASQADLDTAEVAITALQGADTAMDTRVTAAETAITNLGTNKADKGTTLSDYGITDAYTKGEADLTFEKLGVAQAYTDKQLEDLLKDFGTAGDGESGGTGLQGTVASQGVRIGSLEEKVGDTKVADQITNALTALTTGEGAVAQNTADIAAINNAETGLLKQAKDYADGLAAGYETAGAAATAKSEAIAEAKAYTDTEVGKVDAKFTSYTDTAGMNAAIKVVDDKFANYTTTTDLNATLEDYALQANLEAEKTAREEAVQAVSDNLANYATNTKLTEELGKKQDVLSGTGYVTINQETKEVSVTANGAIAADNTGLVTGGTVYTYALPKPTDCTEAKCVLSVDGNGAPYWMKLELAPVTVEE